MDQKPPLSLSRRKLILLIVGVILLISILSILNFLLTHGRLVVEVSGKGNEEIAVHIAGANDVKKDLKFTESGKRTVWLTKGDYTATLSQGYRNTIALAKVEVFKKHTVSLQAKDEAASTRLAGESMGCGIVNNHIYYSYDCGVASQIFEETPDGKEAISDIKYDRIFQLNDGLLVMTFHQGFGTFGYFNAATRQVQELVPPSTLKEYDPTEINIITNTKHDATYQFALMQPSTNTWFLYKNVEDQDPLTVKMDKPAKGYVPVATQLYGDRLITINRSASEEEEGQEHVEKKTEQENADQFSVYSLNEHKTTFATDIPPEYSLYNTYFISDNTVIAGDSNKGVILFRIENNSLKTAGTFSNGGNVTVGDDMVVFSVNSSVYKLDPRTLTAYRLFDTEGFRFSGLNLLKDTVIMQAFTGQQSQDASGLPSAYSLDLTKSATYPRESWSLPRVTTQNQPIETSYRGMDALLEYGVSSFQLDGLKYAFTQFGDSTKTPISEAKVDPNSIEVAPVDPTKDEPQKMTFTVTFNDKDTYTAKIEYFDLSKIRLQLLKPDSQKSVYQSQDIDLTN